MVTHYNASFVVSMSYITFVCRAADEKRVLPSLVDAINK